VLDAWAAILRKSPAALLEIRARHLDESATRAHIVTRFAARGIGAECLRLHGELPYRELLAAYRRVDIALDPFPFSGCTTTCDALWMGCPVITLPGETFVSRQSASLLWRLGRDEWVARDRADYVERALTLAANIESVRAERERLREAVRLRLCDAQAQAADFAIALRTLWRERCTALSRM
jgi:protein O-GlcNAc transferase